MPLASLGASGICYENLFEMEKMERFFPGFTGKIGVEIRLLLWYYILNKLWKGGNGNMNLLQSVLYGFLSGAAEILPISSRAHGILLLKIFGTSGNSNLMLLLLHAALLASLYVSSRSHLTRMRRALALARIPKKKRRRPLDIKSLMDFRLVRTMSLPIILAYFFYNSLSGLAGSLLAMAIFLFLNGLILYIPQFLPTGNKDSRSMSRVEGLLIGLGGALSVLPGISGIGAMVSVSSVCGVDRKYALDNALIASIVISAAVVVNDAVRLVSNGLGGVTFRVVLIYLLSAAASFLGGLLGVRLLRKIAGEHSFSLFAFYCWGLSLFTFFLNLIA